MKDSTIALCGELLVRYPSLEGNREAIVKACSLLIDCYRKGRKLLTCGNGGSASDSQHIVGELMKAFAIRRPITAEQRDSIVKNCKDADFLIANLEGALPAIALTTETALMTAYSNDREPDLCFAQQVLGYGKANDVLLAISTSGNSRNVVYACDVAKALGLKVIGLTGRDGGKLNALCDVNIIVPEQETFKIQELHLPVYHCLCKAVENEFFGV